MADQTIDQFTAATVRPSLRAELLIRDASYSTPHTRHITLFQLLASIQAGLTVKSMAVLDPTTLTPAVGDSYVIAGNGAGGWTGQSNAITVYDGESWLFEAPAEGFRVRDNNTNHVYEWTGSAWAILPATSLSYSGTLTATNVDAAITELAARTYDLHAAPFGSGSAVTVGNGTEGLIVPASMNGMNVTSVLAAVHTKGITGTTDIQVRRRRAGTDADVLSTVVTIGDEFSAADGVIDSSNDDLATGDLLYIDVDAIHSGTAPNGLNVVISAALP